MESKVKKYVLGFAFSREGRTILLIRKNRPEYQKGKLNGVGGKVELEDDTPRDAMIREFKEETGVDTFMGGLYGWHLFTTMVLNPNTSEEIRIYCYKMNSNVIFQCKTVTDEEVVRVPLDKNFLSLPLMEDIVELISKAVNRL